MNTKTGKAFVIYTLKDLDWTVTEQLQTWGALLLLAVSDQLSTDTFGSPSLFTWLWGLRHEERRWWRPPLPLVHSIRPGAMVIWTTPVTVTARWRGARVMGMRGGWRRMAVVMLRPCPAFQAKVMIKEFDPVHDLYGVRHWFHMGELHKGKFLKGAILLFSPCHFFQRACL